MSGRPPASERGMKASPALSSVLLFLLLLLGPSITGVPGPAGLPGPKGEKGSPGIGIGAPGKPGVKGQRGGRGKWAQVRPYRS